MAGPSYDVQVYKQFCNLIVAGRFLPASEGFGSQVGRGFTVTRSDQGKYLVTLDETFNAIITGGACPAEDGDDNDFTAHLGDISATPISSFFVYCQEAGADADFSGWCCFWVLVSHTSEFLSRS